MPSADWKSAIQQVGNLRYFGCGSAALRCIADFQSAGRGPFPAVADWKSAIQQIGNLRYEGKPMPSQCQQHDLG